MRFVRHVLAGALLVAQAALLLGSTAGCERQATASRYSVVVGDVTACQSDIGEITVNVVRRGGHDVSGETLHCTVTGDSEIYINDRFSALADIEPGDRIELIGYRDPNPTIDRFTVTYAHIAHSLVSSADDESDTMPGTE